MSAEVPARACAGAASERRAMKTGGQRMSRSRSLRGASSPERSSGGDGPLRSMASVFRLILHLSFCVASLVLGFRMSREYLFVVVSLAGSETYLPLASTLSSVAAEGGALVENKSVFQDPLLPLSELKSPGEYHDDGTKSSRVHVGRHGILVRSWPHPDPVETMVAQSLIARVQEEQRKLYGLTERRRVIVVTPTHRRSFQALHLSSLMHTLMLVPGPLSWIVVEAGEASAETAALLAKSGLDYHHLHLSDPMPDAWPERHRMEISLRIRGLRYVRENELEGIVMFADESNSHQLAVFDELQSVQWVGAFSVGLLMPPQASEVRNDLLRWSSMNVAAPSAGFIPVQGPACNETHHLVGWHSESGSVSVARGESKMLPKFEWAGFVLNSAALLDRPGRPSWIKDFDEWIRENGTAVSPSAVASDDAFIEPLGNCGREILVWWSRVEARADSKYPEGWVTEQQLEIVVPAKRTPWPDASPPPSPTQSDEESVGTEKNQPSKLYRVRRMKKKPSVEAT